jgi:hypothetical protein
MADKDLAEDAYEHWLKFAVKQLGSGVTNGGQLQKVCSEIFGSDFRGIFPSDRIPTLTRGTCAIANVDKAGEPGSHWVAITPNLFYDSFGRTHKSLVAHAKLRQRDTELDREQEFVQQNRGARCVAFLIVSMVYGDKIAKFI